MDEKILRETFDHNLNESFRLKQLENLLLHFYITGSLKCYLSGCFFAQLESVQVDGMHHIHGCV